VRAGSIHPDDADLEIGGAAPTDEPGEHFQTRERPGKLRVGRRLMNVSGPQEVVEVVRPRRRHDFRFQARDPVLHAELSGHAVRLTEFLT
jgi:hypothetical protein